jgi:uncharacterized UBP type Zn finger protein
VEEATMADCTHQDQIRQVTPSSETCEECRASGQTPVARRMCLVCGNVGCCDSTPGHHATRHFESTGHPVMRSIEPGQDWQWCYVDKTYV